MPTPCLQIDFVRSRTKIENEQCIEFVYISTLCIVVVPDTLHLYTDSSYISTGQPRSCSGQLFNLFLEGSEILFLPQNCPPRMLQTQKHLQIQCLGDPNPIEEPPDQDSAPNPQKQIEFDFAYPCKAGKPMDTRRGHVRKAADACSTRCTRILEGHSIRPNLVVVPFSPVEPK